MTEKKFLKNFRKHCEIARDLKLTHKSKMAWAIENDVCPFRCDLCGYYSDNYNAGVNICACHKLKKLASYNNNAEMFLDVSAVTRVIMLSILKSVPWRK
jgi:hypothetical protein